MLRFPPAAPVVRRASANTSSVAAYRRATFPSKGEGLNPRRFLSNLPLLSHPGRKGWKYPDHYVIIFE